MVEMDGDTAVDDDNGAEGKERGYACFDAHAHLCPAPQLLHPISMITKPSPDNNASRLKTAKPFASKKSTPHIIFN
ncbi:hypothetical protein Tco_0617976 [Tanacetum coccineum]